MRTEWGGVNVGLRTERVTIDSLGNPNLARLAASQRNYSPTSLALAADYRLGSQWNATLTLSRNERAPKDYELFANGPHLATAAYELGDATLKKERAKHIELGLRWRGVAENFAQVQLFSTRFSSYISLENTGQVSNDEEDASATLPIYAYTQHAAKMQGVELFGRVNINPLVLDWRAERLNAKNTVTKTNLPRIAPMRLGLSVSTKPGMWSGLVGVDYVAKSSDAATAAYSIWRVETKYAQPIGLGSLMLFARIDNATNRLAFSPTSILSATAPGRVPLPGRALHVGARFSY